MATAKAKTVATTKSVAGFIKTVEDKLRQADCFSIIEIMKQQTGFEPKMWGPAIIGFGTYHYQSERSKQAGEWLMTGFSPRKQYLTVYIITGVKKYPELLKKLGKFTASTGSCLNIKRLSDIDIDVLKQLISESFAEMKTKNRS